METIIVYRGYIGIVDLDSGLSHVNHISSTCNQTRKRIVIALLGTPTIPTFLAHISNKVEEVLIFLCSRATFCVR